MKGSSANIGASIRRWANQPWRIWMAQSTSIMQIELRRNFLTRRGLWIYLLALAPVFVIALHGLESRNGVSCRLDQDTIILAGIFQFYYLRLGIFFGCLGIFTWLFRGEVVSRTLHYYFLLPLRREVLVAGKFLAGAATAILLFGAGVALSFFLMYLHFGARGSSYLFQGPGMAHLGAYLLATALAAIGYGALFLALSLVLRNPVIAGAIVFFWEALASFLPAILQMFSVTYYIKHLAPVAVQGEGPLALLTVVTEPVAPWAAVIGLLMWSTAVLALAAYLARRVEISYATE